MVTHLYTISIRIYTHHGSLQNTQLALLCILRYILTLLLLLLLLCRPRPPAEPPADLIRHVDLHPQLLGERPHEPRVLLEHPADDGQIETVVLVEQLLGLFPARDGPDGADG